MLWFLLLVAAAWAAVGVLLARWLKQSGHARPFKRKEVSSRQIYGEGVGYGREAVFGGSVGDGDREERGARLGQGRGRDSGIVEGEGRVKGF